MGTRMEVAQLEERMNIEDYRKLQGLFLVRVIMSVLKTYIMLLPMVAHRCKHTTTVQNISISRSAHANEETSSPT